MMDLKRMREILDECTIQLRKGDVVHGDKHLVDAIIEGKNLDDVPGGVVTIDAMPHVSEAKPHVKQFDMVMLNIGVDEATALTFKDEMAAILRTYPQPERLAGGPSYIELGAEIGDQGRAFQLLAFGDAVGFWKVITPKTLGITDPVVARDLAGVGMVMCTGFKG